MELDNLKAIWTQVGETSSPNPADIREMIRKRSYNPLARMQRNLRFEVILLLLLYGSMISFYYIAFDGRFSYLSWILLAIVVFYFIYFYYKNRLLHQMQKGSSKVKTGLEQQIKTLSDYIRFYLVSGTLMAPLAMIFTFSIAFYNRAPEKPFPGWGLITGLFLLTALLTIVAYYSNRWYVRKLYGKHIQRLKRILDEMKME